MMAEPTPEYVELRAGAWCGKYDWPMVNEDLATERLWENPGGNAAPRMDG